MIINALMAANPTRQSHKGHVSADTVVRQQFVAQPGSEFHDEK